MLLLKCCFPSLCFRAYYVFMTWGMGVKSFLQLRRQGIRVSDCSHSRDGYCSVIMHGVCKFSIVKVKLSPVCASRRGTLATLKSSSCSWRESWSRLDSKRPNLSAPSKRCRTKSLTWRRLGSFPKIKKKKIAALHAEMSSMFVCFFFQ